MGYLAKRVAEVLTKEGGVPKLVQKTIRYPLNIAHGWYYAVAMRSLVAGNDLPTLVDRVFADFYGLIRPFQIRSELAAFITLAGERKPSVVLEIGTATGGTLFLLARAAADNAHIISVDLPCGPFGGGYPGWRVPLYRSFAFGGQKLDLVRADSHSQGTIANVKELLGGKTIDILYIDGDHTYAGVKKDFEDYSPFVGAGSLIVFHDIARHPPATGCDVYSFWQEVKGRYRHTEFIADKDQTCFGIGVLFVD